MESDLPRAQSAEIGQAAQNDRRLYMFVYGVFTDIEYLADRPIALSFGRKTEALPFTHLENRAGWNSCV